MLHKFDLNYENFLIVRPLWAKFSYGKYNIPIMWKPKISLKKAAYSDLLNFRNLSTKRNLENRIIENFAYDFELETIWRNPFTHFFELHKVLAVLTPDYSITSGMAEAQIIENTYKNRWMGCFWQQFSISVIPTVSWAGPSTYKICQIGIPKRSPIAVSTLGVADKKNREGGTIVLAFRL